MIWSGDGRPFRAGNAVRVRVRAEADVANSNSISATVSTVQTSAGTTTINQNLQGTGAGQLSEAVWTYADLDLR
eukprot:2712763-Rhodomonas_salina.1